MSNTLTALAAVAVAADANQINEAATSQTRASELAVVSRPVNQTLGADTTDCDRIKSHPSKRTQLILLP